MKQVRVLGNRTVVIDNMTIGPQDPMPVWNEEILESEELKRELKKGTVEIIEVQEPRG